MRKEHQAKLGKMEKKERTLNTLYPENIRKHLRLEKDNFQESSEKLYSLTKKVGAATVKNMREISVWTGIETYSDTEKLTSEAIKVARAIEGHYQL